MGDDSYASRLTAAAKVSERKERSEMMRVLNRIVGAVGIIIIPVGIALFCQQYFGAGRGFSGSIVSMVAAAIGMIPEGLYFLTSIALAVSTVRLAQRRVMLHDMKSIETLARVDVLCLDKTGTITDSGMTVNGLVGICGRLPSDGEYVSEADLEALLCGFMNAMPGGNNTNDALKDRFAGSGAGEASPGFTDVEPFSSVLKYASAVSGGYRYMLGAPEMILADGFERIRTRVEHYSAQGFRTLLFARVDADRPKEMAAGRTAEELALITLENRVRKTAPATFKFFKDQGVEIKIISGDSPLTVSRVAAMAGVDGAERYVDARELTTDELIAEAAEKYTVFGRVETEVFAEKVDAGVGHGQMTHLGMRAEEMFQRGQDIVACSWGRDAGVAGGASGFGLFGHARSGGRRQKGGKQHTALGQPVPHKEHILAADGAALDNILRALSHAAHAGDARGGLYHRHTGLLPGAGAV